MPEVEPDAAFVTCDAVSVEEPRVKTRADAVATDVVPELSTIVCVPPTTRLADAALTVTPSIVATLLESKVAVDVPATRTVDEALLCCWTDTVVPPAVNTAGLVGAELCAVDAVAD